VFWGVYKVTPEGLGLVGGIGRNREDAINAACRALGYPPFSEHRLTAAGWTIGKLRAFVEED
jgi:hypothetical protein